MLTAVSIKALYVGTAPIFLPVLHAGAHVTHSTAVQKSALSRYDSLDARADPGPLPRGAAAWSFLPYEASQPFLFF